MKAFFGLLFAPLMVFADEAEIKMLITPKKLESSKTVLEIKTVKEPEVRVCFFDTAETVLDANKLILRLRMEEKTKASKKRKVDAVVKLRGTDKAPEGFENLKPEADWVGPDAAKDVKSSFSIKSNGLNEELMGKILDGQAGVEQILSDDQKRFASAALKVSVDAFPWGKLQRFGVIEVWKSKRDVGSFKDVTVELWRLKTEGKEPLELLEISIKTQEDNARPVAEVAADFYAAAQNSDLGKATGESKTQKVIEYYRKQK